MPEDRGGTTRSAVTIDCETLPCQQQRNAMNSLDSLIDHGRTMVKEVDNNGSVTSLQIHSTTCSAIPADFGSLFSDLNTLHLTRCPNLTDVSSIRGMRKIRELRLYRCPVLRGFPQELCEGLQKLELEHCNAFDYALSLRNLEGLEEFRLQDDDLEQVPLAIWSLSNLKRLVLLGRRLTAIPNEIGNLINLEDLNLEGFRITSVSRGIGALVHLKNISFWSGRIIELPDEMGDLTAIESVKLSYCCYLKRIPVLLLQLPRLSYLDLNYCYDLSIPTRDILECTNSLIEVKGWHEIEYCNDLKRSHELLQHMAFLNRDGRYLLKEEDVALALWGSAMYHWSKNVDSLFYFLTQKPDIIPASSGKRQVGNL